MPNILRNLSIALFILYAATGVSSGQHFPTFLSIGTGPVAYRGDLNERYDKWGNSFQLSIFLNKKDRVNGEFNVAIGQFSGQNNNYEFNGEQPEDVKLTTFFTTNYTSGSYNMHINFVSLPRLKAYGSIGIGLMRFNPKNLAGENLLDIPETRLTDESYVNTVFIFPIQAGFFYHLPNGFGAGFQANLINSTSDYLDNMSLLGNRTQKDNLLSYKFHILIPITLKSRQRPQDQAIPEDLEQQ